MQLINRLLSATLVLVFGAAAAAQTATFSAPQTGAPPVVFSALDANLFYDVFVGEMSLRNGDPAKAFAILLDAARRTNDADLYSRAVEMAFQSRSGEDALLAARTWHLAQPKSVAANEREFQVLVALNRLPETVAPLRGMLTNLPAAQRSVVIARSAFVYSRATDKKLAAATLEQALTTYLAADAEPVASAQAWASVGRLRLAAGDVTGALEAGRKAQNTSSTSDAPAALALDIIDPKYPQAEAIIKRYLENPAPRSDIRMAYTRALIEMQRYADANVQLQITTKEQPQLAEAWLVQGSIALQDNDLNNADASYKRYLQLVQEQGDIDAADRQRGLTQAYLGLAQLAEKRKDFALAESWLAKIDSSQALVSTQSRRASILAKQGKLDEARQLIRALPQRSEEDKRMKLLTELGLLRENQKYQVAYDFLANAIGDASQDYELIYQQATFAEKLDKWSEMERLLRRAIEVKPDYAEAYNALGYSFADRNLRLTEAKALIQKALEHAPGDPFISDSLAWVEFRLGNKVEAIKILEVAFKTKPDAEIAAHLGEVYWSSGQRAKATAIWKQGMLINPENDTLLQTIRRLRAKL